MTLDPKASLDVVAATLWRQDFDCLSTADRRLSWDIANCYLRARYVTRAREVLAALEALALAERRT
jgi:hypothetical protein